MFENIAKFFKKLVKSEEKGSPSKNTAKERLHLVLMQDRANVSADFLELMKQEIIEVIKKYIEVEEAAIDVRLTNEVAEDGSKGAPSLYANIPIVNIKNGIRKEKVDKKEEIKQDEEDKKQENKEDVKEDKEKNKIEKKEETEETVPEEIKPEENKEEKQEEKIEQKDDESINETKKEENKNTPEEQTSKKE